MELTNNTQHDNEQNEQIRCAKLNLFHSTCFFDSASDMSFNLDNSLVLSNTRSDLNLIRSKLSALRPSTSDGRLGVGGYAPWVRSVTHRIGVPDAGEYNKSRPSTSQGFARKNTLGSGFGVGDRSSRGLLQSQGHTSRGKLKMSLLTPPYASTASDSGEYSGPIKRTTGRVSFLETG